MFRFFIFVIIIAIFAIGFLILLAYFFGSRMRVKAAKVDANHKVNEAKADVEEEKIYDDTNTLIKSIRKRK